MVQTVSHLYSKVLDHPSDLLHHKLAIDSIYEVLKAYTKDTEYYDHILQLKDLWEKEFDTRTDALFKVMDECDSSQESRLTKDIFILTLKIILKVFKIFGKETGYAVLSKVKDLKTKIFEKAIDNADKMTDDDKELDLKSIVYVHRLEIYGIEYLAIEKDDVGTYLDIAEYYYRVSFDKETLTAIKTKFLNGEYNASIEHELYELARILAQGIRFHKSVIENPYLWVSDMIYNDSNVEDIQKVEDQLKNYYSNDKLRTMCDSIIVNYLPLDQKELETWEEDPTAFYFQTQEMAADSMLREQTIEFIKAVKMRFPTFVSWYVVEVMNTIKNNYSSISTTEIKPYLEKEALFNFCQEAIDIEEHAEENGFLSLIDQELSHTYQNDIILKRRMILILASIADHFNSLQDKKHILSILHKVVEIFSQERDSCIKLTCLLFFHEFYNDFYLQKDTFADVVPAIFDKSCELLAEIKKQMDIKAVNEIMGFFTILTQKYPEIAQRYIENEFISDAHLPHSIKAGLAPVLRQLLAIVDDEKISPELANFTAWMLHDLSNLPVKDVLLNEEVLKLLLVFLRRLQNYPSEHENPFTLSLNVFKLSELIIEQLSVDPEEMLHVFLVLEEMHFSLFRADPNEINKDVVMDIYTKVFRYCFETAETCENAYIVLLSCYYASTLVITEDSKDILAVACEVLNKVKKDLVEKLVDKQEKPDDHHKQYLNGFLTLFSCICLVDCGACATSDIANNPTEVNFLQLLTHVGQEYTQAAEGMFEVEEGKEDEFSDNDSGDQLPEAKYTAISFAVVYIGYCMMVKSQGGNLEGLIDPGLKNA